MTADRASDSVVSLANKGTPPARPRQQGDHEVGDIDACRQAIDNAIRKADEAADYRTAMKAVGEAIDAATRLDAALLRSGVSFDDMSDQTESDHKRTSEASLRVQRKFL